MSSFIRTYSPSHQSHRHDGFHQIVIPLCGKLEIEIEGKPGQASGHTLALIARGEKHAFHAAPNNHFLVLDIEDPPHKEEMQTLWEHACEHPYQHMSEALLSLSNFAAIRSRQTGDNGWFENWQALFLQTLCAELNEDVPNIPRRIERTLNHIHTHLAHPLTNQDLAGIACLSPARFHDVFRQSTGVSPQQYLTRTRLKMAKRLILQGMSLSDTALEVGFSDQSALGRAFQKAYAQSPGQWRKQELQPKKP